MQFWVGAAQVGGVFKDWKRGSISEKDSKKLAEWLWGVEWVCDNVGEEN